MAILGFIVCVVAMGYISFAYGLLFIFSMGQYSLGGGVNSNTKKAIVLVAGCAIAFAWFQIFKHSPFEFRMS